VDQDQRPTRIHPGAAAFGNFPAIVAAAIEDAIRLNVVGFAAVKQLAVAKVEKRAPARSLEQYPFLPRTKVRTTKAADYMALVNRSAA
jgi:hypothetical protein